MNIKTIRKKVLSSDGKHALSGIVYIPEGEVKGIFHVVHGMREHIGRYDRFMKDMAEQGYIVFGYDHLGHGRTAEENGNYGYIAPNSGWKYLVNDVAVFGRSVKKQYGEDLPYILLGHSMGSFIVRIAAAHFDFQDKLIVMGTGGPNSVAVAGVSAIRAVKRAKGGYFVSDKIEQLTFGDYNKHFEGETDYAWLCNNIDVQNSFINDPMCQHHFTISAMEDLVRLSIEASRKAWFERINKEKPILIISGSEDPVGNYGEGVKQVTDMLNDLGANVQMKLYEGCRHELLSDIKYDEVFRDIKQFVEDDGI